MAFRTEKVGSIIQKVVNSELRLLFAGQYVSVTEVRVSADLRHATLWVSALRFDAPAKDLIQAIETHHRDLQQAVAKQLKSKFTPRLAFRLDEGYRHAERISNIKTSS